MKYRLKELLRSYIIHSNPELIVKVREGYSFNDFLDDKLAGIMDEFERMLAAGMQLNEVEANCLEQLTRELQPSRFRYVMDVIETEFPKEMEELSDTGVIVYEALNVMEACRETFDEFPFTRENIDNRFLRYAIIAEVANYFN